MNGKDLQNALQRFPYFLDLSHFIFPTVGATVGVFGNFWCLEWSKAAVWQLLERCLRNVIWRDREQPESRKQICTRTEERQHSLQVVGLKPLY